MRLRCPVCHAEASLEAWAENEAARELMGILSGLDATLGRALAAYLGLWRSSSRALSWERALRVAREALALEPDAGRLAAGMSQTVEAMRSKREAGDVRPLSNHNYLRRVLEGLPREECARVQRVSGPAASVVPAGRRERATSATMEAMMRLEALKRGAVDGGGGDE